MSADKMDAMYEFLALMGDALGGIHFRKIPDMRLLDAFADMQGEQGFLAFDRAQLLGTVSDIAACGWSNQIISARLESDIFCEDLHEWFEFGKMRKLSIIADLEKGSLFDEDKLCEIQRCIAEGMPELNSLEISLACSAEAFSQAKYLLMWPDNAKLKYKIIRNKRPRRHR